MRRISILVLFVWIFMATAASAQQSPNPPHFGKGPIFRHHLPQRMSGMAATQGRSSAQGEPVHQAKSWELGTYPGGTWAALGDINDFGVAVGMGDVPPIDPESGVGVTHTLAVSLFGPHAGEWRDLGTLGGSPTGWEEPINRISDTGVAVGYSVTADGHKHGIVWTEKSGLVDLGTLADIGYSGYDSS